MKWIMTFFFLLVLTIVAGCKTQRMATAESTATMERDAVEKKAEMTVGDWMRAVETRWAWDTVGILVRADSVVAGGTMVRGLELSIGSRNVERTRSEANSLNSETVTTIETEEQGSWAVETHNTESSETERGIDWGEVWLALGCIVIVGWSLWYAFIK